MAKGGQELLHRPKKSARTKRVSKKSPSRAFLFPSATYRKNMQSFWESCKKAFSIDAIDYIIIFFLGFIIIGAMFFMTYMILSYGSTMEAKVEAPPHTETPAWAPKQAFVPSGVKAIGAKQLPKGCAFSHDDCWKRAVANGAVKFIETEAKILIPGYENQEVVFAYFKNTSDIFGTSGLYNCLPMYKKDGRPIGSEIFGGINAEIDWVYGTKDGVIIHDKTTGGCFEKYFDIGSRAWTVRKAECPK